MTSTTSSTAPGRAATASPGTATKLSAREWRAIARGLGADDVGLVEIERAALNGDRADLQTALPTAKSLVSFVVRMNRQNLRTPARSIANLEFHHASDEVNDVARRLVRRFEELGIRALNGGAMGFPMEAQRWPGKMWVVSHKPVAVAAGLGRMGIHRNVIHPRFGSFVLLGTVVTDAAFDAYDRPLEGNPCFECKLCVAACPTGAIHPDGHFDFAACYTHNYREFMGGFIDWVERIAASASPAAYRRRVSDAETVSMWQSLSFGANYKAAYCLGVCPAGEDVIGPYLADKKGYVQETVRPVQQQAETVYVLAGSDAETHVAKRFPAKSTRRVGSGLRAQTVPQFLAALPLLFQRGAAKGLDATYHFTFTGEEPLQATVRIRDQHLEVEEGHAGRADLRVRADSRTWLRFLAKEVSIVRALLTLRVRLSGPPRLLVAFGRCFPS